MSKKERDEREEKVSKQSEYHSLLSNNTISIYLHFRTSFHESTLQSFNKIYFNHLNMKSKGRCYGKNNNINDKIVIEYLRMDDGFILE